MFKTTIEQNDFFEALKKIKPTVGKGKDVNNVYNKHLYLELFETGGIKKLKLVTTNMSETSVVIANVIDGEIGVCGVIPEFNTFFDMINTIDDVEISIEDLGNCQLSINYKTRKKPIIINGIDSSAFLLSDLPKGNNIITIPGAVLKDGIDKTSLIIHESASNKNIADCVHIITDTNKIQFQARDMLYKRIMVMEIPCTVSKQVDFFVECSKLKNIINSFDISKDITFNISNNNIVLEQDDINIYVTLRTGTFPNCDDYIPKQFRSIVSFNKNEMINSLKRISLMYDKESGIKTCELNIQPNFLDININSMRGEVYESVLCNLKGRSFSISFNVESLIKSLNTVNTDDVKLCFKDRSCGILKPVHPVGYNYRCLMQPVRDKVSKDKEKKAS